MKRVIGITGILLSCSVLAAQTASDHNLGSQITHDGGDNFTFRFWGASGWTAFPQISTDLESWNYAGQLAAGRNDVTEFGVTANLQNYGDAIFMRLKLTDAQTINAERSDFDNDSISNSDELRMGTDPLGFTDTNMNGIPDDVDALWASIPSIWKDAFVADPNNDIYDPDNSVNAVSDLTPLQDYDGDGILDIIEYVEGTDPLDYYNGDTPDLTITQGAKVKVLPGDVAKRTYILLVKDSSQLNVLRNAPVVFEVESGPGEITSTQDAAVAGVTRIVGRTNYAGKIHTGSNPVYFKGPASIAASPTETVVKATAGDSSVTYTSETVSALPPSPPWGLTIEEQQGGGYIVSWYSAADSGAETFYLNIETNGVWERVLSIPYSQLTPTGDYYQITVDANYNLIP